MKNKAYSIILAIYLSLSFAGIAESALISYTFEGTIWTVIDNGEYLGGSISTEDTFTGTVTYDLDAIDSASDPNLGEYNYNVSPNGFNVTINGISFTTDPNNIDFIVSVNNGGYGVDSLTLKSDSNNHFPFGPQGSNEYIWIYLQDHFGNALTSDLLPSMINLADWGMKHFIIKSGDGGGTEYNYYIDGTLSHIAPIPIPGAVWLLGSGLSCIVVLRRKKKA